MKANFTMGLILGLVLGVMIGFVTSHFWGLLVLVAAIAVLIAVSRTKVPGLSRR